MNLSLATPTPLAYFSSLVQSDDGFPLFEAAVSLAQDEYPDLDVQQVLGEVDQMQARLKRRIPQDAAPMHRLRLLNQFFFTTLGFGGNVNNYYDPENSFINVMLRGRRGIPITLAVLWLELAQGLGLSAQGVGFPGHFMMKISLPRGQVVMDPMDGKSLSREQLAERLEPFRRRSGLDGGRSGLDDDSDAPLGLYLQASPARDIIARMLRNLKEIYKVQQDWPRLLAVQDRLIVLLPQAWSEYRDRGMVHSELSHAREAVADLETYVAHASHGPDMRAVMEQLYALRRTEN
jgi:regulator of sirC expression with transglutaminase-like and TPR domain